MNPPERPQDDEAPDEVTRAYARASAADAGAPSPATRAAILAEARIAAQASPRTAAIRGRRAPANDARYLWRAAAGVAVLGVAVLVWRQLDHDRGGAPLTADTARAVRETTAPRLDLPPAPAEAARARAPAPAQSLRDEALQANAANAARARSADAASADTLEEAVVTGQRATPPMPASAPPPTMQAMPAPAMAPGAVTQDFARSARRTSGQEPPAQLLQRYFPEDEASATPARAVWIVLDAGGNVLRSGRLDGDDTLNNVLRTQERELADDGMGPWNITTVTNSRGAIVQLAIARVR